MPINIAIKWKIFVIDKDLNTKIPDKTKGTDIKIPPIKKGLRASLWNEIGKNIKITAIVNEKILMNIFIKSLLLTN